MTSTPNRKLKVFLCHSSDDKPAVWDLYQRLKSEGWIDPWLDEEKLYPGQDWDREIEIAVEESESVLILLSKESVEKESYVQYELRSILHIAKYKPAGVIFVLPLRINDCEVPRSLRMWQHIDYFPENRKDWAYERILGSLKMRAAKLGIDVEGILTEKKGVERERTKEERRKKIAAEKARIEKVTREKKATEERKRKKAMGEKEERERKIAAEKARQELAKRTEKEKTTSPPLPEGEHPSGISELGVKVKSTPPKPSSKPNPLPFLIGGGVIAVLFALSYFTAKSLKVSTPVATERPPTEIPATATKKPPTEVPATSTQILTKTPVPTPTLGIGSTMISEKDGMTLLYVPAGEFEMGSEQYDTEKPIHIVYLDAYWIDQTEATNAMYARCVVAGACDKPNSSSSYTRDSYYGNADFDNYPVVYVSWENANNYCAWAGRRLLTEAEWEKAAGWNEDTKSQMIYPWGGNFDNGEANFCDMNCTLSYKNESYDDGYADTSPVDYYESGKSFYGVYGMAGNVWEWVADWYEPYYYARSPLFNPLGPEISPARVPRGGSWDSGEVYLRTSNRVWYDGDHDYTYGFRCAFSIVDSQ